MRRMHKKYQQEKETKECLIYLEGEFSRTIEKRNEEGVLKPIFEKDSIDRRKKKFYLTIDTIKTKSAVNKEGKRTYNYNVIWIINEIENNFLANEVMLLAQYESTNENEFKILIRSVIIGLLIICEKSEVILGINEYVNNLLYEFTKNLSNRKKIDSEFYIELLFIENLLKNSNIDIIDYNDQEYKEVIEIKKKARGMLKDKNIVMTIVHKIEIIEEALLVNEYNLIWNKKIVMGGFRMQYGKTKFSIAKN
ncbi:unnamed protein product [Rhizophagus irregularis]|nr:unnamed protein product [Rhizophagus irregularis]